MMTDRERHYRTESVRALAPFLVSSKLLEICPLCQNEDDPSEVFVCPTCLDVGYVVTPGGRTVWSALTHVLVVQKIPE
jgi:hypothetical protein